MTYSGGGGSQYTAYIGPGTVRVTLPQPPGMTLPTFDQANPAEPDLAGCKIDMGAYHQDNTGYICSFKGTRYEAELIFPSPVTLHLVSGSCYPFPDLLSRQPARVDVWNAQDVTDGAPDATYAIGSSDPCSVPPPPPPVQPPDVVKAPAKPCAVPALNKLTLTQATAKLKKAGCKRGKVTQGYSTTVKKGRVISQSVKARKKVKRGTSVKLRVSKGPRKKPASN